MTRTRESIYRDILDALSTELAAAARGLRDVTARGDEGIMEFFESTGEMDAYQERYEGFLRSLSHILSLMTQLIGANAVLLNAKNAIEEGFGLAVGSRLQILNLPSETTRLDEGVN